MAVAVVGLAMALGIERAQAARPLGIDVSHWQGSFNWTNARNAGVEFAYCKATQGTSYTDDQFANNQRGAVKVGIPIGAYHFAQYDVNLGTNGAIAEANHFWAVIKTYVKADGYRLMPMLDLENVNSSTGPGQAGYTKTTFSQWANAFCTTLSNSAAAVGITITPVIYTSSSFGASWLNSTVTQWIPWIANWNGQNPQTGGGSIGTSPWPTWVCWQYGSMTIPGSGSVDGDVFRTTYADLVATLVIGGGGPDITSQPQSLLLCLGSNATFSVTATGSGTLSYQWRFNGADLAGATEASLTRTNAQFSAAGSYSVAVSDTTGTTVSSNAVLVIHAPPIITSQPQDAVAVVGGTAAFLVGVSGGVPFSYQWLFNGNPLPGATSSSYVRADARSIYAGSYSVLVSNDVGWAASSNASLVLIQDAAWGDNTFGQGNVFAGTADLIAVAAGAWHNLGLRAEGTVVAWGNNASGQAAVPEGLRDVVAIAAGDYHNLAIRLQGDVVAWGADDYGQADVPNGLNGVIGIAAGTWHSVALRADGTVVVWGDNSFGQTACPAGLSNVTAVAAAGNHTLALKADGTVVAWGENTGAEGNLTGQSVVPRNLTNVAAIGAGTYHSLAVKKDGTVVAWGDNSQGQCGVPAGLGNVVAVAGGGGHSVALGVDGAITAWGADWNGQCAIPPALMPASGVAAGAYHTLVLLSDSLPVPQLMNPAWKVDRFSALIQTLSRQHYALDYRDSVAASNWTALSTNGGNGALRVLSDPGAAGRQRFYRLQQW